MSIIQEDREQLKFRAKQLEPEHKVQLRDAVVSNLLEKCKDKQIGMKVSKMWHSHKANVRAHEERMEKLQMWDEYIDDNELMYDGESNLHIPMPLIVLKTFHARMYQALMSIDPPFAVKAMQEAYQDDVEMVYGLMSWTLGEWCNFNEGVDETVDRWLWNWCGWGSSVLKLRWDREFTRYVDVIETMVPGPSEWEVVIGEDGTIEEVESPAIIKQQIEQVVTEKTFEGPVFEYVNKEDIAIIGGRSIQRCDAVIHREWFVADRLRSYALQGVFDDNVVREIIEAGPDAEAGREGMTVVQDRETHSGIQTLDIEEDLSKYEILEAHLKVDVNDDGLDESIIVWVDAESGKVLRATYAHRVHKNGKRPFVNIEFIPREGHGYAMGLLELLFPLSVELDFIHNIKIDIGLLAAQPFGFYRAATGMDPVKLKIKPGDMIPVDDPQSHVFFPNLGDRGGFFKDEEMFLLQHIERLTAINDINTATLGRQGVARTATGVSALVSENSANLDIFIKRMQRGWRQALRLLWGMLQQRMPNGTEFRVTGKDGREYFSKVDRRDIQVRIDFVIEATSANSNRMIMLEQAQQVLAQCMNPFFYQLQIVKSHNVFEALKDYFQALGKRDWSRFIEKPTETYRVLTAEEELRRILAGYAIQVTPELDHEGFINLADKITEQENFDSMYGPEARNLVDSQKQQHQAMLDAMMAQAAQIQQANQQMFNAMGPGSGIAPGQAPILPNMGLNTYNDFQIGRSNLNQEIQASSGQAVPGMANPKRTM
jgi:hypothetical protein